MPIEFWKAKTGWFWTARSPNGRVISDSAEIYSSRAKAILGAKATAREFEAWQDENRRKTQKVLTEEEDMIQWLEGKLKAQQAQRRTTSGHQKPAAKRSTSSSNPTRKTAKRGG
jgi:hypothetical protein